MVPTGERKLNTAKSHYNSNRRILSITPGNQPLSLFFLLDIVLKTVTNKKLLQRCNWDPSSALCLAVLMVSAQKESQAR